jgi:5-methylcytosine-specific restriction endonuclease McrA
MQVARARRPERVKAAKDRDYRRNRTSRLAAIKRWRERNPERVYALAIKGSAKRRSRLDNVIVERIDRLVVFERDRWICGLCLLKVERADASIDHIIPIAKGGDHTYKNVQLAHLKCNLSKGARIKEIAA